jgi:hypothetical protein
MGLIEEDLLQWVMIIGLRSMKTGGRTGGYTRPERRAEVAATVQRQHRESRRVLSSRK